MNEERALNYYEHHLGDYAAATAHLSWDEDMAYTRLIRAYYHHEKPIPADLKEACRFARAQSPAQRKAVEAVLREFFVLLEDGWHQKRCDEEIEDYREKGTDRLLKAESERERQRRSRERRRQLFEALRGHGVIPKWDTPISELEAHLSRVTGRDSHAPVTVESREPVTRPVTPATGSQSPFPVSIPIPSLQAPDSGSNSGISNHPEPLVADSLALAAPTTGRKRKGLNGSAKRLRRMPTDQPTEHMRRWATENAPGVDFDREIAKLRDHQFRDAHSDWDAVIRNWMRKAQEFGGAKPAVGRAHFPKSALDRESEALERAIRAGLSDEQILALPELQEALNLEAWIVTKREEIQHAGH